MKIFLVGEGPTDCGKNVYQKREGKYEWQDGPVQIYLKKLLTNVEIETMDKNSFFEELKQNREKRNRRTLSELKGHGRKAFFVAEGSRKRNCDVAAVYVDADKTQGEPEKKEAACQKRYDEITGEIKEGLKRGGSKKHLAIVPMKMIECWLMGDPEAFVKAFGTKPDPALLRRPELIWGDYRDPDSGYPKNQMKRIMEQCGETCNMDSYNRIAEAANPDTVIRNCPISFADFVSQIKSLT